MSQIQAQPPTPLNYLQQKARLAELESLEPLGEEGRAFWQQRVNDFGRVFDAAVARNRSTTAKEVRQNYGQGRSFGAKEAKQRGMVDGVATFDEVLAWLQSGRTGSAPWNARAIAASLARERVAIEAARAGIRLPNVNRELERERLLIERASL